MSNNNKTPAIRFKGFTDTWEQRKFSELTEIRSASRVHKEEWQSSGVPFYRSSDVMAALNGTENEKAFISEELYEKLSAVSGKLEKGDILVTGGGSVGKPYIVPNNEPLYTKDADLLWVKNNEKLVPYFIYTFFFSPAFSDYLNSVSHVGTIAHYTITQLEETPITLPCVSEQQKIGDYFRNIDSLITLHQRKCDKLIQFKAAMLQKMFPQNGADKPEIRFKGFTDAWEQRELGDMGRTYTGLSGKTKDDFGHGQARFVTYMNVFSNPICNSEMTEPIEIDSKQNEVEIGDVFFTTSSETPEEVGMSSVLLKKQGKTYLNSFCFGFRPSEKIDSYYLAYMLRSEAIREKIILLAQGISRYNISKNKVMEIAVSLPSLDEQAQIGQYFTHLDRLITLHQRKCDKYKSIKAGLIRKLFP